MSLSTPRDIAVAFRRRAALPIVLAVAVAAGGCASAEDAEFVDGYNAAVAPLSTTMSRLDTSLARDPAAASKSLDQVADRRSEEHTSELQSRQYLVCRLL